MVIRYERQGRLLDVGTGTGQFLNAARNRYEVEGTEVSRRAIDIASEKYGLRIHEGALEDIDFFSSRFDVITLFHVLEHVHDPGALLSRCGELLSTHGIVVIAVPNEIKGWKRPIKRLLAHGRRGVHNYSKLYGLPRIKLDVSGEEIHLSHFTIDTIRKLVNLCGLRVIDEDLDPCHASTGPKQFLHELAFRACKLIYELRGPQLGEAIWIAAVKQPLGVPRNETGR
jgi:SAM-dependent methyltransferase